MVKTRVKGTGIDQVSQSKLFDPTQPLYIGVINYAQDQIVGDVDEPEYRVIQDFYLVQEKLERYLFDAKVRKNAFFVLF
jgi:hypothetical protein